MNISINAQLLSNELSRPVDLPLSECANVEFDNNIHCTCFRNVKFLFPAQDISGKIGFRHPGLGMIPCTFGSPVEIIGDVFIKHDLLLNAILLGDKTGIAMNGSSSRIRVCDVDGIDDSFFDIERRNIIHEIFRMKEFGATIVIS